MATLVPNEEGSVDVFEDPIPERSLWETLSDDENNADADDDEHDSSSASLYNNRTTSYIERDTFATPPYTSRSADSSLLTAREEEREEQSDYHEDEENIIIGDWEYGAGLEEQAAASSNEFHPHALLPPPSNNPAAEPSVVYAAAGAGGALVNIIGGVHKGKTAFFVSQTEKRVGVRFPSDEPNKVRYLALSSVDLSSSSSARDFHRPSHSMPDNHHGQLQWQLQSRGGEQTRTLSLNPNPNPNPEPPTFTVSSRAASSNDTTTEGETVVEIIAGGHKGKRAFLIKRTPKRVGVRLLDDDAKTVRYLSPSSIRVGSGTSSTWNGNASSSSVVVVSRDMQQTTTPEEAVSSFFHYRPQEVASTTANHSSDEQRSLLSQSRREILTQTQTHDAGGEAWSSGGVGLDPSLLHSFLNLPIQSICLQAPGEVLPLHSTFAALIFQGRLIEIRIKATANVGDLPRQFLHPHNGCKYDLLVTKLQTSAVSVGSASFCSMHVTAIYVLVSGPGVSTIDLKAELNMIAAFGELQPKKAASRLELLCSTARKSAQKNRDFLIFHDLTSEDFEIIPEVANEGCGFCPPHFIKRWLGNHAVGKRTFALQVRVFGSKIGVAKGVLLVKPGINKIQLPTSMIKVGPTHSNVLDKVVVLVTTNGIFPFSAHCHTLCTLFGDKAPPKSFRPKKLSNMILSLFTSLGVPRHLVNEYAKESQEDRGKHLKHANLIGLADPTNSLPSGHIFVTGIKGLDAFGDYLFVTRYPCTESVDGTMLPIVREKPRGMSDFDWTWLQSLHFGGIIFANPLSGQPPLPNMIADGDLDGDLYFVCWHKELISHIRAVDHGLLLGSADLSQNDPIDAQQTVPSWNENWLEDAQDLMRSVGTLVDKHRLISVLYKAMESAEDPSTAVAFSRAYKEAIDIGKHGGSVKLSKRHWNAIHERFHRYLCDE